MTSVETAKPSRHIDASVGIKPTPALLNFLREASKTTAASNSHLSPECVEEIKRILDDDSLESISFALVKSVHDCLTLSHQQQQQNLPPPPPLWRLVAGGGLSLPRPPTPKPNPELAARLDRLRAEQAQREYDRMTADVRSTPLGYGRRSRFNAIDEDDGDASLGSQLRIVNRQLATVVNFLLTVGAAFAFGYKACELTMSGSGLDGGAAPLVYKLSTGLLLALIVFFADLYFVVKIDYLTGKKNQ